MQRGGRSRRSDVVAANAARASVDADDVAVGRAGVAVAGEEAVVGAGDAAGRAREADLDGAALIAVRVVANGPGAVAVRRGVRAGAVAAVLAVAACFPALRPVDGQQIACADDDECPTGFACAESVGRCVAGGGCIRGDGSGDAVADGTPCDDVADGVCVAGVCAARFCGDGVVDVAAGEGCDPRFDPACRADCTQPWCGDGVLDLGESCEGDGPNCVRCTLTCGGRVDGLAVLLDADCDGDVANGCECAPGTVAVDDREVPVRGLIAPAGALVVMYRLDDDLVDLRVYDADGAATTLRAALLYVDVARHGDRVFGVEMTDADSAIFEIRLDGDAPVVADVVRFPLATDVDGSRIAVDDEAWWLLDGDGVYRVDRGDHAAVLLTDACIASRFGRLVSCGDALACVDAARGMIFAVDKATGAADVLQQGVVDGFEFAPQPACLDGAIVWHDGAALSRRGPDGPVIVAALPQESIALVALNPLSFAVARGDEVLLSVGSSIAAGDATYAVDPARRSARGVAAGLLLDATDDGAFLGYHPAGNRLVVLW